MVMYVKMYYKNSKNLIKKRNQTTENII